MAKTPRKLARLIKAIQARDVAEARAALDAGADPSGVGAYDVTPLGQATTIMHDEAARNELTKLLLDRGADPNDRGPYRHDNRPVLYATYCGYEAVVRMLIDAGGFPRDEQGRPARNSDGSTLLALACESGMRWLAELALAEGCRADDVDHHGSTALHYATEVEGVMRRDGKDTKWFIEFLLEHGAPLEHERPGGWGTAMHWAVGMGDAPAVRTLVARGADLERRSEKKGQTPLVFGARMGSAEALRTALELGADARAVDAEGRTALHEAAARLAYPNASAAVVEVLLAAGVDASARDGAGLTALEVAVRDEAAMRKVRGPGHHTFGAEHAAMLDALVAATDKAVVAGLKLPR
jgi:ankyrin repeat protein